MQRVNQIEPKDIGRLNPLQFVQLLRTLLYAEARQHGLAKSGVHVPLAITVADGGEDGRWEAALKPTDCIPHSLTLYQAKATDMTGTDCFNEMLESPKAGQPRKLKPRVQEAIDKKGCYCFFCSHEYNSDQITARTDAAREALKEAGSLTFATDNIAFLDASKIAAWTNGHIAAIAHVSNCAKLAHSDALLNWSTWAKYNNNRQFAFASNPMLMKHITELRNTLVLPNSIARITGMSGLGKTRLAFEVFRPITYGDNSPPNTALSDSMLYFDLAEPTTGVLETIRQFAHHGVHGIIVADNCHRTTHDKLVEFVNVQGSCLSLLSLDYEPESLSIGFLHISLEPEHLIDVIPRMLAELPAAKSLTDSQINHIAKFCRGFPQLAYLLAISGKPLTFANLTEKEFAGRLLWGHSEPNQDSFAVIKALSLFAHVGVKGAPAKQLSFVASKICKLEEREVREKCVQFQRLRIIQPAGDYWIVSPQPLAIALAVEWWECASAKEIMLLLPGIHEVGLTDAFCNQLQMLNYSANCHAITDLMCEPTGPFSQAEVLLSEPGSRLFRALVELNPAATLRALKRVLDQQTDEVLKEAKDCRRNLVWALEKLLWESDNFIVAAPLLLRLAAAENESWGNNASGVFPKKFQLYLSGTQCPAQRRLEVLEICLQSKNVESRRLCVDALVTAIRSPNAHFSRTGGVETRGSSLPQEDWRPKNGQEISSYNLSAFRLLKKIILSDAELTEYAKTELGRELGSFLIPPYFTAIRDDFSELAKHCGGCWPTARESIGRLLQWSTEHYSSKQVDDLKFFWELLTPVELALQLRQLVTSAGYRHAKSTDGQYVDEAGEQAQALGRKLGTDESWYALLPNLLRGGQDKAFAFGAGLAATHPRPAGLISMCLDELRAIPPKERNPDLLCGIIRGTKDTSLVDTTLDTIVTDPSLAPLLVRISTAILVDSKSLERIVTAIAMSRVSLSELNWLCYGSVIDSIPADVLVRCMKPLLQKFPDATVPVYDVIVMYVYRDDARFLACQPAIREILMTPLFVRDIAKSNHQDTWRSHAEIFVEGAEGEEFAVNQTRQIVNAKIDSTDWSFGCQMYYSVLRTAFAKFGAACWPIVGEALLRDDSYKMDDLIAAHESFYQEEGPRKEVLFCTLSALDPAILAEWAKAHPDGGEALLRRMGLFITLSDGSFDWEPSALELMNLLHERNLIESVGINLICFGSMGSRVPYLKRRISLAEKLLHGQRLKLKPFARHLIDLLNKEMEQERTHDEEWNAGIL